MFKIKEKKNSIISILKNHLIYYPTPIHLSYMWNFGSTAGICLIIQLFSGILLSMHYVAHVDLAFSCVEHIMRDVNNGWLLRYIHSNGASMFFIVLYIHIGRSVYYQSYKIYNFYSLWCSGVLLFILVMGTAFLGYVLPWGQMSFWGATVITNFLTAFPIIGESLVYWVWGGFSVNNATLNRFYTLHYLLPFIISAMSILHLKLLHEVGSNNPLGINSKTEVIPFHPYFWVKDIFGWFIFIFIFIFLVCFYPNYLGHFDNYIQANPMVTPAHIVPEWYFLPYYAILRAIPNKLLGILLMGSSLIIWLIFPLLLTKNNLSSFNQIYKIFTWFFFFNLLLLGILGSKPVEDPYIFIGQICTTFYFFYFVVVIVFDYLENLLNINIQLIKKFNV